MIELAQALQLTVSALEDLCRADAIGSTAAAASPDQRFSSVRRRACDVLQRAQTALAALAGSDPTIALWENPGSEALYLHRQGEERAYYRCASDGGLFLTDAARMAADASFRPSDGHDYAGVSMPAVILAAEGFRRAAIWVDGHLQALRLGELRFGTLRYLGFTPQAQLVALEQASVHAWQTPGWAEQGAHEAAHRAFEEFWSRSGINYETEESAGFCGNYPPDEQDRARRLHRTTWLEAVDLHP